MKFAHMADCHIGSWRDPKLQDVGTQALRKAIDKCIQEKVDFVIIAGDLFNTSLPRIENLKEVVSIFKRLREKDIPVYIVPGSHDYSPSGKTMLDVLEETGMFANVVKGEVVEGKLQLRFTVDPKTGVKLTGMLGKRLSLEKSYYENMASDHLEKENGYKIFIFHSGIDELKTKDTSEIITQPISLLPKGFDYYAGGHVHIVKETSLPGYKKIAYPGPLFPNSFSELETLERGGFYIVEDDQATWHPIQLFNIVKVSISADGKKAEEVTDDILYKLRGQEFINTLILIRVSGCLAEGKPSDIDVAKIYDYCYGKSAFLVMKNTNALTSKEFEEVKIEMDSVEETEKALIKEHVGQIPYRNLTPQQESALIGSLMLSLTTDKGEGENKFDFEERVKKVVEKVMDIKL